MQVELHYGETDGHGPRPSLIVACEAKGVVVAEAPMMVPAASLILTIAAQSWLLSSTSCVGKDSLLLVVCTRVYLLLFYILLLAASCHNWYRAPVSMRRDVEDETF